MKKKISTKRRSHTAKRKTSKKLHHRVISFFKGDGGIYVIFVLATVMAGAFALTGGVIPALDPKPSAANQVTIDPDSANRSSASALQLVDLKIKPTATPTPTPINTPTPQPTRIPPTATPTPTSCLNKIALNLMLDVSSSMNSDQKIGALNTAMVSFVGQLTDETVVGATEFAGLASFPNSQGNDVAGAKTLLAFTKANTKANKNLITSKLTNLSAYSGPSNDGTYMRSAFTTALRNLNAAKSAYASQGYKFVTIMFTDGVPETQNTDHNCYNNIEYQNPYLCFAKAQDPRTDLTTSMKNASSKVYSVGVYSGARELQAKTEAVQLLKDIASKSTYTTSTSNPTALTTLFGNIITSVCN